MSGTTVQKEEFKKEGQPQSFSLKHLKPGSGAQGGTNSPAQHKQMKELKEAKMTMHPNDGGPELKIKLVGKDPNKRKPTDNSYLVRVRSGSPPDKQKGINLKNNKSQEEIKQEFENQMAQHPEISKDVNELQRFNFVLASRSHDEESKDEKE